MRVDMNIQGMDGVLKTLQSLPKEVVSKRGGPVKLALAKGARLIRDEAKKNLRAQIATGGDESTGLLEKNVIASRGKAPTSGKGERYLVRVKRKTYGGRKVRSRGGIVTTRKTAMWKEYGRDDQPATPWLRPAVHTKGQTAINVITQDLKRRIDVEVKKLAARNK